MVIEKIPINDLSFGVGRPEEWEEWQGFLQHYSGSLDDLQRDGTLWSLKLLYDDIAENGTTNFAIVKKERYTYKVLVGNQRLCVQKVLGYEHVDCVILENVDNYPDIRSSYQDTDYDKVRRRTEPL